MRLIQLLRESITVHPKFKMEVSTNRNITRNEFKPIAVRLNRYPGISRASVENEVITVEFDQLDSSELQTDNLEQLGTDILNSIDYHLTDLNNAAQHAEVKIVCDGGLPAFPISCPRTIEIACKSNTIISGISKLITECEMLEITGIDKLHPQGILDILRLPQQVEAMEFGWEGPYPKWADIIYGHFEDERDLLECKEELMNANLKEWAKL